MSFGVYGGTAWWDRAGTVPCVPYSETVQTPPADTVYVEDSVPAGAAAYGSWNWVSAPHVSGSAAHTQPRGNGYVEHYFQNASTPLVMGPGEDLVTYVLLNQCDRPREIILEWQDETGWKDAYWGEDLTTGSPRYRLGNLPAAGDWVRLVIPSAAVGGLSGHQIRGFGFFNYNGQVWWDHTGKTQATPPMASLSRRDPWKAGLFAHIQQWWRDRERVPAAFGVTMRPVAEDAAAPRRYSFYTPELNLLSETQMTTAATPMVEYDYIWFGGQPVGQVDTMTGAVHWTLTDHLGTPILQTDSTGAVDWRVEYEPYGNVFATRAGLTRHQPLRFPGQEADDGDRSYNIFRWYRAGWGTYSQSDPLLNLAFAKSVRRFVEDGPTPDFAQPNWYGYAANNPLSNIDELGLKLTNSTKCVVYVKPENGDVPVLVPPGQTYPGDQDGYAAPCTNPDHVFKTVDNVDVNVGPKGPDTDANGFVSAVGQIVKGGWKDEDWKKKLDKKGDYGWDKLFDKSKKSKCLCCAQ